MERVIEKPERGRSDSIGDSAVENAKRKREMLGRDSLDNETGLADIFKRSNKLVRSPGGNEEDRKMLSEMREEIGEGMKCLSREIREVARDQKEMVRLEIEKMREEMRIREEGWRKEREEMREKMERLEIEIEKLKSGIVREGKDKERRGGKSEVIKRGEGEVKEWGERIENLERKYELKERGDRKRNILIRGLREGGEEGRRKEIKGIMEKIGVEVRLEEIRKVEAGKASKGAMIIVKVGSEGEKRKVMENKWKLRGEEIWIDNDLTWEERRVRWRIRQMAREIELEGKRVKIGQGKLWIEGEWWVWDEKREVLRDGRGRCWEERGENGMDVVEEMGGEAGQGK